VEEELRFMAINIAF